MSANCKWCGLRPATQDDHNSLKDGDDGGLCWREWNRYAECFEIEEMKKEAAPELLEALKLCASVCSGETLSKNTLINALEKARSAISKAKGDA